MLSTVLCIFYLYFTVFTDITLNFRFSVFVLILWLLLIFMAYDIMLWSELLSSSLILRSTLFVATVKSILFLPIRFSKVVFFARFVHNIQLFTDYVLF